MPRTTQSPTVRRRRKVALRAPLPKTFPHRPQQEAAREPPGEAHRSRNWPIKPPRQLTAMIASDVPKAGFISSLANKTSAGRMRKPPPTPRSPVSTPTATPIARQRTGRHSCATGFASAGAFSSQLNRAASEGKVTSLLRQRSFPNRLRGGQDASQAAWVFRAG